MNKKAIIGICAGVVAVAAIVLVIIFMNKGDDLSNLRNISVFEMEGSVNVTRDGKNMDAVKNMKLRSGDDINVGSDSYLRLAIDEDKYVYVDENTNLRIVAEGSSSNNRSKIAVAEGHVITEIQQKLNGDSSFDVITPNSTMAIRGTTISTRIELVFDENHRLIGIRTYSSTLEGTATVSERHETKADRSTNVRVDNGEGIVIFTPFDKVPGLDDIASEPFSDPGAVGDEIPVSQAADAFAAKGIDVRPMEKEDFREVVKLIDKIEANTSDKSTLSNKIEESKNTVDEILEDDDPQGGETDNNTDPEPSEEPPEPSDSPSPTEEPTPEPTEEPTSEPTPEPTEAPIETPPDQTTDNDPPRPTNSPTPVPTEAPTETPSPTEEPTETPSPTEEPTETPAPTEEPTETPSPTEEPTETPTPTEEPTETPTPTPEPTPEPTPDPTPTNTPEPTPEITNPPYIVVTPTPNVVTPPPAPTPAQDITVTLEFDGIYTNAVFAGLEGKVSDLASAESGMMVSVSFKFLDESALALPTSSSEPKKATFAWNYNGTKMTSICKSTFGNVTSPKLTMTDVVVEKTNVLTLNFDEKYKTVVDNKLKNAAGVSGYTLNPTSVTLTFSGEQSLALPDTYSDSYCTESLVWKIADLSTEGTGTGGKLFTSVTGTDFDESGHLNLQVEGNFKEGTTGRIEIKIRVAKGIQWVHLSEAEEEIWEMASSELAVENDIYNYFVITKEVSAADYNTKFDLPTNLSLGSEENVYVFNSYSELGSSEPKISFKEFDDAIAKSTNGKYMLTISSTKTSQIILFCNDDMADTSDDDKYEVLKGCFADNDKVKFDDEAHTVSFLLGDAGPQLPIGVTSADNKSITHWTIGGSGDGYTSIPADISENTTYYANWGNYAYAMVKVPVITGSTNIQAFNAGMIGGLYSVYNVWDVDNVVPDENNSTTVITLKRVYNDPTETLVLPTYYYLKDVDKLFTCNEDPGDPETFNSRYNNGSGTPYQAESKNVTRIAICSLSPINDESQGKEYGNNTVEKCYYVLNDYCNMLDISVEEGTPSESNEMLEYDMQTGSITGYTYGNLCDMYKKNGLICDEYPYWDAAAYSVSDHEPVRVIIDSNPSAEEIIFHFADDDIIWMMYPKYVSDDPAVTVGSGSEPYTFTIGPDISVALSIVAGNTKINITKNTVGSFGGGIYSVLRTGAADVTVNLYKLDAPDTPLDLSSSPTGTFSGTSLKITISSESVPRMYLKMPE